MTDLKSCRHCGEPLTLPFADLGTAPPSNSYVPIERLDEPETFFPLKVFVCEACWLVQTLDFAKRELFFSTDYAYFSSVSKSWLSHSESYVKKMISRFDLDDSSTMVEIASNDGYLLQYAQSAGLKCYGIEPTRSTAEVARSKGIETVEEFFGCELAQRLAGEGLQADVMTANNVLAHVPDVNDFISGFAALLKEDGIVTFEFPHLWRLVTECQFDTIYHEHYSYLSLLAVHTMLAANGLSVFDVEELSTHGGSLRVYAQRTDAGLHNVSSSVAELLGRERDAGMASRDFYLGFQDEIHRIRDETLSYLIDAKAKGLSVAAYGAAAKGNTLLNFCGIKSGLIAYVCDMAASKQGQFLPGTRLPIYSPEKLDETQPDRILILPWNLRSEVSAQLSHVASWGGRFVVAIPRIEEFDPTRDDVI